MRYNDFFGLVPDGFVIDVVDSMPWDLLKQLESVLHAAQGPVVSLPIGVYVRGTRCITIREGAEICPSATLEGPVFIGKGTKVMPGAYIRASWIGSDCIVGHGVELARSILHDGAKIPHRSVILDSILGRDCNIAGASTANVTMSNLRAQRPMNMHLKLSTGEVDTGLIKLGLILGDNVIAAAGLSSFPGTLVSKDTTIYPRNGVALSGVHLDGGKLKLVRD